MTEENSVAMSKKAMGIRGLTVVMALSLAGCASGETVLQSENSAETQVKEADLDSTSKDTETSEIDSSCSTSNYIAPGAFDYRDGGIRGDQLPCELQDAAMYLSSLGMNVPKSDPEFHLLYGDIVTAEMRADYPPPFILVVHQKS